jgi:indolepyruvate decarboxylase
MSARSLFEPQLGTRLTQDRLWQRLNLYLREGDTIVSDQGSCGFGLRSLKRPVGVSILSQGLWAAIGWSLPALLGAGAANPDGRHVLLIGDGAFALTAQEISTMMAAGQAPLIVVLNNGGYLVEDFAGGRQLACNDLWSWKYSRLPDVLDGSDQYRPLGLRVETEDQLESALHDAEQAQSDGRLVLLEFVLDRYDAKKAMGPGFVRK